SARRVQPGVEHDCHFPIRGARSKSYYIPADVRAPLIGKWQSCSTPGCTRRAETSEIDHIIPFDHDVVVESHPPDNPINAEHARQVDSCARSQDPPTSQGRSPSSKPSRQQKPPR